MRIAQICPYDIDRPGGVQKHIRDTAAALEDLGHEVMIIAPRTERSPEGLSVNATGGVTILRLGRARKISLGGTGYELSMVAGSDLDVLRRTMRDGAFDIAHYHTMWVPFLPIQAFWYARAPAIGTFHDTTAATLSGAVMRTTFRALSKLLLPRLAAVIAVSDAPLAHLDPNRDRDIALIPPCTNLRRFAPPLPKRRFNDNRVNILFVGRLEQRKGVMVLLQAYRELASEGLPLRLILAGRGPQEDALRRFASENALQHVEFIGDFKDAETPALYAEADIFCAPSPYGESFGIVVAEAMASGKPVVAAANGGYRSLLRNEGACGLVAPGDPAALRDGLRYLIADPDRRAGLGAWGRREAMHYDCHTVAPQLLELYRRAIRRTHGAAAYRQASKEKHTNSG